MVQDLMKKIDDYVETRLKYGAAEYNPTTWDARNALQAALAQLTGTEAGKRIEELQTICGEAYVVVSQLLLETAQLDTDKGEKILDHLGGMSHIHGDVLPWQAAATNLPNDEKKAKVHLHLVAESGYESKQIADLSIEQWQRIQKIVNEYHGE